MEMQVPARSTWLRVQPLGARGGCCRYRVNSALILVPVSTTRNVASQALPDLGQVLTAAPADPEQTTQAVYIGLGCLHTEVYIATMCCECVTLSSATHLIYLYFTQS